MAASPRRFARCSRSCRLATASRSPWKSAESPAVTAGERLVVGQVRGFHGLRGTVRVESLTDRAEERFAVGRTLFREGGEAQLTIVEADADAVGWRLRFAGGTDRRGGGLLR